MMSIFKKLFGQSRPSNAVKPIFPGESYSLLKLNLPEGLAIATVNMAYNGYPNKAFYPYLVGIELEIIDKNNNGHPTSQEAEKLNKIQEEIEASLKADHIIHSVARITRNGTRDMLIYIDGPKVNEEQVKSLRDKISRERKINFTVQKDPTWNAVSGFFR